jgi:hypothetical protein
MPDIIADTADIDDQIAVARENLRELIERAAAYSGAADDDLVARRIAGQEARLELSDQNGARKFFKPQNPMQGEET